MDVTGIDYSQEAITMAQEKVQKAIQAHMGLEVIEVQVATQLDPFDKPRKRRLQ